MRRFVAAALALTALLPLALAATAGAGGYHEDARFGFKFKPPRKWSNIAIQTDEGWLAAKYLSDKTYFYTDEDTKWTTEHTPELLVIAFIEENMKRTKEVEEKTEDGVTDKRIKINNPYKDYEDFLDRTYSGGGFYVDEKERTEIDGIPVTQYTIKVEKLSRNGPKRILTWIWHTPGIDFAMQVEVLEGEYRKLKRTIESSFKSFEQIERTEGHLPTDAETHDSRWITIREMDEGTPKERRTKRMDSQRALHERAVRGLPDDWEHFETGGVLVLSHTDRKYAKRVGDHAKVFLDWLEDTFPYIGKGEYVRAPIVRICADREEEGSYSRGVQSGGGWWLAGTGEIVTHKDDTGWIGWEMDWVNQRLFDQWLQDRDRELSMAMPEWLRSGLRNFVEGARAKGRRIDFRVDGWNRDETRLAVAQGNAASPRELIRMTRHELYETSGNAFWNHQQQSAMFVRYLMSDEARRTKQARDLIEYYIKALDEIIDEELAQRREDFKDEKTPATEEEEAELARKRAERWQKEEDRLMDEIYQRVFGDWKDSDWEDLERGFFDYAG